MSWAGRRFVLAVLSACALAAACGPEVGAPTPIAPPPSVGPGQTVAATAMPEELSTKAVVDAVVAAATIRSVPGDLRPPLELADADAEQVPRTNCGPEAYPDAVFGECVFGDVNADKTVVLFGDSHAGMWETSFHLAGLRGGWKVRVYEQGGCPAPRISFFKNDAPNTACDAFREAAIKEVVRIKPAVIVVTSASFYQRTGRSSSEFATPEQWEPALEAVLKDLAASGAKLIVLGDLPVLLHPAAECLAAHMDDINPCRTSRTEAFANVYHGPEAAAAAAVHAAYIDPSDWFCSQTCSPIIGNMLVYRNQFHITATYGVFLAGAIRAAIGKV